MSQSVESMKSAVVELRKQISKLEAAIAEHEGKPARAWFNRIVAGDANGDVREAYLASRAEDVASGGPFYFWEDQDEVERIKALVQAKAANTVAQAQERLDMRDFAAKVCGFGGSR